MPWSQIAPDDREMDVGEVKDVAITRWIAEQKEIDIE